ncbi:MAG: endonuclease/exonuclease/phosphatase family protein [Pseudomonadota bacterium]
MRAALAAASAAAAVGAALGLALGTLGALWFPLDAAAHFRVQLTALAAAAAALAAAVGARGAARLAGASALCGVALSAPHVHPWANAPAAQATAVCAARLSVAAVNLLYRNPDAEAAMDDALAQDADVLATIETPLRVVDRARARYPHHVGAPPGTEAGVHLFSKRPLRAARSGRVARGRPGYAGAEVTLGGAPVSVLGLHVSWPLLSWQDRQLSGLPALAAPMRPSRVALGDFNAAPWSAAMARAERALSARLAPGYRITWTGPYPPWGAPAPIGHAIDHALLSPDLTLLGIETFDVTGSDHRGVIATVGRC